MRDHHYSQAQVMKVAGFLDSGHIRAWRQRYPEIAKHPVLKARQRKEGKSLLIRLSDSIYIAAFLKLHKSGFLAPEAITAAEPLFNLIQASRHDIHSIFQSRILLVVHHNAEYIVSSIISTPQTGKAFAADVISELERFPSDPKIVIDLTSIYDKFCTLSEHARPQRRPRTIRQARKL